MRSDLESLRWFNSIKLNKYPHFLALDKDIWDSFITTNAKGFFRFSYDVPLVDESHLSLDHPVELIRDWSYLTAYKIDVIAEGLDGFDIIEVKPILSMQAIGQVLTYSSLFNDNYINYRPLKKRIVVNAATQQLLDVCIKLDIIVSIVMIPTSAAPGRSAP